jgi:hypothetical protein
MYILEHRYPVAVNVGKIDYNMVYRWKQLAMCKDKAPLIELVSKQERPDEYRIEEYPD